MIKTKFLQFQIINDKSILLSKPLTKSINNNRPKCLPKVTCEWDILYEVQHAYVVSGEDGSCKILGSLIKPNLKDALYTTTNGKKKKNLTASQNKGLFM